MTSSKTTKDCWQWTIKMLKTTDFRSVSTKFVKTSKACRNNKTKSTKASNLLLKASRMLSISFLIECNLTTDGERSTNKARSRESTNSIKTSKISIKIKAHKWTKSKEGVAVNHCRQKLIRLVKWREFLPNNLVTNDLHHPNNSSRTLITLVHLTGLSQSNTMRAVKRWEVASKIVMTIMLRRTMYCSMRMMTVKMKRIGELEEMGKRYNSKMQHLEAKSEHKLFIIHNPERRIFQ